MNPSKVAKIVRQNECGLQRYKEMKEPKTLQLTELNFTTDRLYSTLHCIGMARLAERNVFLVECNSSVKNAF